MKKILLSLFLLTLLILPVSADTVIVFANYDHYFQSGDDAAWGVINRVASSGVTDNTPTTTDRSGYVAAASGSPNMNYFARVIVNFPFNNTMPTGSTITGATVEVYGNSKANALGTVNASIIDYKGASMPPTTAMWGSTSYTRQASDIEYVSFSTTGYNAWTLTNYSMISTTGGNTSFILTHSADVDNSALVWASTATSGFLIRPLEYSSGVAAPKLTITFTPPDTTPPNSITGLSVSMVDCNKTAINWTNPTDADYFRLNGWLNGTLTNQSNSTTSLWLTGLPENSAMMYNTTTEDLAGNGNVTHWQNISWTTATCPGPTPTPTPTPTTTIDSILIPWCARQDLFFYNASSDISGYRKLKNYPELDSQRSITSASITSSSGEVTLGTWITEPDRPGEIMLAPGIWDFSNYLRVSSDAGITLADIRVFNQTSNGTKTWFWYGNAIISDINKGIIPQKYELTYARRNLTQFFAGDRLGIQINVSTDADSARTVTMDMAGNTNASMVSIAYFLCPDTATPTTAPATVQTWQPEINPSTDIKTDYMTLIMTWWWLPVLMLAMIYLFGRK